MLRIVLTVALLLLPATLGAQSLDRYPPSTPIPDPKPKSESGTLPVPHRTIGSVSAGDRAPDFELDLAGGGKQKLSSLRGGWVALWFGSRASGLAAGDSLSRALVNDAVTVVVVAAERTRMLRTWLAKNPTRALLLSDPTSDIASAYGAFDAARGQATRGLVLLDASGVVKFALVGHDLTAGEAARMVQIARTGL